MKNTTKPTVREIRTILASHNLTLPKHCFNDKRVNGGRIKLWGKTYDLTEMQYLTVTYSTVSETRSRSI